VKKDIPRMEMVHQ
jgi:hypothetical protein